MSLLDAVSTKGTRFFPDFPLAMAARTEGYKSAMWTQFAEMGRLMELRVGLVWEREFNAVYSDQT